MWCQKPCKRHCERWRGMKGDRKKRTLCIWYYKHGWTLTLLVQLICVSILLAAVQTCPGFTLHWLLLIVNVTQLQRRASTVDWSSPSLTSWLTAANTPQLTKHMKLRHTHSGTTHILVSNTRCTGLSASGRSVRDGGVLQVYGCWISPASPEKLTGGVVEFKTMR